MRSTEPPPVSLRSARALAAAAALIVALAACPARADEPAHPCASLAEAPFKNYERLEREGVEAYKAKDYAAAIKSFETARSLCDRSQSLIFALGRSYHLSGNCASAIDLYRAALQLEGKKLDDISNRLTEAQAMCASRPGTLEVTCTQPGVALSINGEPPAACPLRAERPVGPVSIYATLADHQPHAVEVEVRSGEVTTARVPALAPEEADVTLPPPPPPTGKGLLIGGWSCAGVGVVAVGAGAALMVAASSNRDEVNAAVSEAASAGQPVRSLTRQDALDKQDKANTLDTTGAILLGVGGAALATGAVLLTIHYTASDSASSRALTLTPTLSAGAAGFSLCGSF